MTEVCHGVHIAVVHTSTEYPDAYTVLRGLLSEVDGSAAGEIAHLPSGQPVLPRRPDLAVSVSHDGDWLAASVGIGVGVGIDVQCPYPVRAARLRWCGSAARVALAALPDVERDLEYARIWTVQESCVKAAGTGMAGRPWTIPVAVGGFDGEWRDYRWHSILGLGVPVSVAHGAAPTVRLPRGCPTSTPGAAGRSCRSR